MNLEQSYYNQAEFWAIDSYNHGFEFNRLLMSVVAIPPLISTLLDVGAGNGVYLSIVEQKRKEIECTGLERSTVAIDHIVCKSQINHGNITKLPYDNNSFDLVSALEVIEHLPFHDYEPALLELSRVAHKYILISVPYKENRLQATCPYCGCSFSPHYHMRSYKDESFSTLFLGFEVINSWKVMRPVSIIEAFINPMRSKIFGKFPANCICAQCGYSNNTITDLSKTKRFKGGLRNFIKWTIGYFPKTNVPAVAIVLYRRCD